MNVYELARIATAGNLEYDGTSAGGQLTWLHLPKSQVTAAVRMDRHVATQIRHRYNNFMRALSWLRRYQTHESSNQLADLNIELESLIAELEEVEE